MKKGWVDFKAVREGVDFGQVLTDYGVEFSRKGEQAQAFCPLPNHNGTGKSRSFSANLKRNIWQCFGCGGKGNAIDFTALMEGLDPDKPGDVRKAALLLQERYLQNGSNKSKKPAEQENAGDEPETEKKTDERECVVNAPLDFVLKGLDPQHGYLKTRNLGSETIAHFGLGFCRRGMMKGRIVIPLHDSQGQLIGYAGRIVDDAVIDERNPKYRLPGSREREGVHYQFAKSRFLFNGHRIDGPVDDLIVVEGFFGAMWMVQGGFHNVVALMGASCSEEQGKLIVELVKPSGRIWLIPDGDEAGRRCAQSIMAQVAGQRFTRWIQLEDGKQPEDVEPATCMLSRG